MPVLIGTCAQRNVCRRRAVLSLARNCTWAKHDTHSATDLWVDQIWSTPKNEVLDVTHVTIGPRTREVELRGSFTPDWGDWPAADNQPSSCQADLQKAGPWIRCSGYTGGPGAFLAPQSNAGPASSMLSQLTPQRHCPARTCCLEGHSRAM